MCKVTHIIQQNTEDTTMKYFATISSTNQNITQCQFGIEVDIDDNAEKKEIELKIDKAAETLKAAVNRTLNLKPLVKVSAPAQLPAPTATSRQVPVPATPGQIKFMKDLTKKCGTTFPKWCQEKGINPDEITKEDAKNWIPELQFKANGGF